MLQRQVLCLEDCSKECNNVIKQAGVLLFIYRKVVTSQESLGNVVREVSAAGHPGLQLVSDQITCINMHTSKCTTQNVDTQSAQCTEHFFVFLFCVRLFISLIHKDVTKNNNGTPPTPKAEKKCWFLLNDIMIHY